MAYLKLYQLLVGLIAITVIQAVPSNYARDTLILRGVPEPVRKLNFIPGHLRQRRQTIADVSSEEIEVSTTVSQSETDVVSVQQTDAELVKKVVKIQAGNQEIIAEQDELRLEQLVTVQKTVVVQVVQQVVDVRLGVAVRQITKVMEQQEKVTAIYQVGDANIITVGAGRCGADASAAVVGTGTAANVAVITTAASAPNIHIHTYKSILPECNSISYKDRPSILIKENPSRGQSSSATKTLNIRSTYATGQGINYMHKIVINIQIV